MTFVLKGVVVFLLVGLAEARLPKLHFRAPPQTRAVRQEAPPSDKSVPLLVWAFEISEPIAIQRLKAIEKGDRDENRAHYLADFLADLPPLQRKDMVEFLEDGGKKKCDEDAKCQALRTKLLCALGFLADSKWSVSCKAAGGVSETFRTQFEQSLATKRRDRQTFLKKLEEMRTLVRAASEAKTNEERARHLDDLRKFAFRLHKEYDAETLTQLLTQMGSLDLLRVKQYEVPDVPGILALAHSTVTPDGHLILTLEAERAIKGRKLQQLVLGDANSPDILNTATAALHAFHLGSQPTRDDRLGNFNRLHHFRPLTPTEVAKKKKEMGDEWSSVPRYFAAAQDGTFIPILEQVEESGKVGTLATRKAFALEREGNKPAPPRPPVPPEAKVLDVQAIIDKRCMECHKIPGKDKGHEHATDWKNLSKEDAEEALTKLGPWPDGKTPGGKMTRYAKEVNQFTREEYNALVKFFEEKKK